MEVFGLVLVSWCPEVEQQQTRYFDLPAAADVNKVFWQVVWQFEIEIERTRCDGMVTALSCLSSLSATHHLGTEGPLSCLQELAQQQSQQATEQLEELLATVVLYKLGSAGHQRRYIDFQAGCWYHQARHSG